ncbi:MAG: indolepyruvate ferredoxin oxidoreductase family protein [Betaproteobacteria bacterium]|nr:indolepyruvate ferredoxin oxidoreductase family protein [Betaproteobacteria bacterium]
MAPLREVTLDDKYTLESGRIYLSGVQALVRLPLLQHQRDAAAGLDTAGFITGYRGSPLGTYDSALNAARRHLDAHRIAFRPGVNEDLAATALWGTQQVGLYDDRTCDGVFGIFYGKGPGVDRSTDALKHANLAGTAPHGGVLLLAGDDHACQSSTTAHQSEQVLIAAMIPVLNPATVQDYLDFGLVALALSRYSGCWIAMKAISETVESSASVDVDPQRVRIVEPADFAPPPDGLHLRWPDTPLDQERRLHGPKMDAVRAFARANRIDRIVLDAPRARLGIVATGKAYLDVRQALADLGIDDARAQALGIRLYKVGLSWPLEPAGALAFAEGLDEILVVEEKRPIVEDQLAKLLYAQPARPRVTGKCDESGAFLMPTDGELSPAAVANAVAARLARVHGELPELRAPLARLARLSAVARTPVAWPLRTPFFCAGCPHNTSTRVPEGSRALAGIGCHYLALHMPRQTRTFTHMGGEGAAWTGVAPFVRQKHAFQNIGDGTYFHSGLLAIRAAAAAGTDITYKILFNDAVAMTGGQPLDGHLTVPQITQQVAAEGARRIVVVTDEPWKYPRDAAFAPGVTIRHRDELDAVQRELRDVAGLTVLVYDQTCAAEKRRRRKRGTFPDPPERVFVNDAVCEGCGDCSEQSNCVAVRPLETDLGRKRTIDQSSCNKDYSCVKGFCPSFVTVRGVTLRKAAGGAPAVALPEPAVPSLAAPYAILVTGIGGTGVVTIGALLGMAAHLEGRGCSVLDFTGLAQKNGAVTSHVRLAPDPADLAAVRVGAGGADLVLGCDLVVAASPAPLATIDRGRTRAVINGTPTPTAQFVLDRDMDLAEAPMRRALQAAAGPEAVEFVPATALATALMGDAIATNLFLLGYAFQRGLVPLSRAALERAIELNGTAVDSGKAAFAWGRLAAHDRAHVERAAGSSLSTAPEPRTPAESIEHFAASLAVYQDAAYADRFRERLARVAAADARLPAQSGLAEAAARSLHKLMAYKDEYEVARLYTDGAFAAKLARTFDGTPQLAFHLAPPLLARRDPATAAMRKRRYGAWMQHAMRVLARMKSLRGTPFDPFGRTPERRAERQAIADFERTLDRLAADLDATNYALAVEIARLPDMVRGFGHVKARHRAAYEQKVAALLAQFRRDLPVARAAD